MMKITRVDVSVCTERDDRNMEEHKVIFVRDFKIEKLLEDEGFLGDYLRVILKKEGAVQ